MACMIINLFPIYVVLYLIQGHICDFIDPGNMFDYFDSSVRSKPSENERKSSFPFLWTTSEEAWFTDDTCSTGTGIVLKRIVKKLFNHLDSLQPNELDDEFIYQSALSYNDYSNMLSYLKDERLSCANLHKLETILSNFLTTARVSRTSQTSHTISLINLISNPLFTTTKASMVEAFRYSSDAGLITIITIVCLTKWLLSIAGYSEWKSFLLALVIPGFIQFYIYQHSLSLNDHREKLDRCLNVSSLTSFVSYFWDYNNCRSTANLSPPDIMILNVGEVGVKYISELIFHPIIIFAAKFGQASQSYLSSFSGWIHYALAPFFLIFLYVCMTVAMIYIAKCLIVFALTQRWYKNQKSEQRGSKQAIVTNNRQKRIK